MSGLHAPQFQSEVFRKNHKMIIAQNRHLATIGPVRLVHSSTGYLAGQVLARDPADGLFKNYDDAGASGVATASCVLLEDVDSTEMSGSTGTAVARAVFGGELYEDKLVGLDANAKTDLKARTIVDALGINVLKF